MEQKRQWRRYNEIVQWMNGFSPIIFPLHQILHEVMQVIIQISKDTPS